MHIPGYQKNGTFHTGIQKNWAIHILFVEKKGPVIYLAALKKGAIRHAHPYYAIYRKLHTPPPPHPEGNLLLCATISLLIAIPCGMLIIYCSIIIFYCVLSMLIIYWSIVIFYSELIFSCCNPYFVVCLSCTAAR